MVDVDYVSDLPVVMVTGVEAYTVHVYVGQSVGDR